MIVSPENRAVFTNQLMHRRRGRPRVATPMVRTSVRLPEPLFDACCHVALASGRSLPEVVRQAVADQVAHGVGEHFTSQSNAGAPRQW